MIASLVNLLFESRHPRRYVGRHRASATVRYVAAAPVPARWHD
jgi:hypothetical protein